MHTDTLRKYFDPVATLLKLKFTSDEVTERDQFIKYDNEGYSLTVQYNLPNDYLSCRIINNTIRQEFPNMVHEWTVDLNFVIFYKSQWINNYQYYNSLMPKALGIKESAKKVSAHLLEYCKDLLLDEAWISNREIMSKVPKGM